MARKILNRKALRDAADAAEAQQQEGGEKPEKKKATKRKSKAKDPEQVRKKLFWGVFNQNMKLVAKYDFNQKKSAEMKAQELSTGGNKTQHFVQRHTEEVVEKE